MVINKKARRKYQLTNDLAMKRYIMLGLDLILVASLFLFSCKKQSGTQEPEEGQVEINFSISNLKSVALANSDTVSASTLTSVIVSIEDLNGKVIKNSEKIDLYNMNGSYISKPLSLTKGNYKLTHFLVLDWQNNVVYAAPLKGSDKAYLVTNPIPMTFAIQTNSVTKVSPEVINAASCKPEDFGYATFSFNIAQTFDFLVGTFIYNDTIKNYKLTSSTIAIYTDTVSMYSGQLTNKPSSALTSIYDSLGVTNKITLPERFNSYTLVISKPGYKKFSQTFTKEELKLHLRSVNKGPLVVILEKIAFLDGLIAFYKFNGDVKDYSGNNNNGTYYGRGVYSFGYKSDTNGAIDLNGSTDYIVVKNSPSLNMANQITVCAWYYRVPFSGAGRNSILDKSDYSNWPSSIIWQYRFYVTGSEYSSTIKSDVGLSIGLQDGTATGIGAVEFGYNLPNYYWYFVVCSYDGKMLKIYINGQFVGLKPCIGNLQKLDTDLYIGTNNAVHRPEYDFITAKFDDIRIYNRALSDTEILNLYQQ